MKQETLFIHSKMRIFKIILLSLCLQQILHAELNESMRNNIKQGGETLVDEILLSEFGKLGNSYSIDNQCTKGLLTAVTNSTSQLLDKIFERAQKLNSTETRQIIFDLLITAVTTKFFEILDMCEHGRMLELKAYVTEVIMKIEIQAEEEATEAAWFAQYDTINKKIQYIQKQLNEKKVETDGYYFPDLMKKAINKELAAVNNLETCLSMGDKYLQKAKNYREKESSALSFLRLSYRLKKYQEKCQGFSAN